MKQAMANLTFLFENFQAADAEKRRVYALADDADDAAVDAAEVACDAAYDVVERLADAILAVPAGSVVEFSIKAQVLLARGAKDLLHYRPTDLTRFVQELRGLARS